MRSTGTYIRSTRIVYVCSALLHTWLLLCTYVALVLEVVLPLHISHVVLCEGFGAQALELLLSFLYTGSVDINEGSPYVS